jgi:hypothetical protein
MSRRAASQSLAEQEIKEMEAKRRAEIAAQLEINRLRKKNRILIGFGIAVICVIALIAEKLTGILPDELALPLVFAGIVGGLVVVGEFVSGVVQVGLRSTAKEIGLDKEVEKVAAMVAVVKDKDRMTDLSGDEIERLVSRLPTAEKTRAEIERIFAGFNKRSPRDLGAISNYGIIKDSFAASHSAYRTAAESFATMLLKEGLSLEKAALLMQYVCKTIGHDELTRESFKIYKAEKDKLGREYSREERSVAVTKAVDEALFQDGLADIEKRFDLSDQGLETLREQRRVFSRDLFFMKGGSSLGNVGREESSVAFFSLVLACLKHPSKLLKDQGLEQQDLKSSGAELAKIEKWILSEMSEHLETVSQLPLSLKDRLMLPVALGYQMIEKGEVSEGERTADEKTAVTGVDSKDQKPSGRSVDSDAQKLRQRNLGSQGQSST